MSVADREGDESPSGDQQTRAIESFFARIGLSCTAVASVGFLLAVVVWLGGGPSSDDDGISVYLVSRDGKQLSSASYGVAMTLSPGTFYLNQRGQERGEYRINALGLRGPDFDPASDLRPRILLLGGSAAFGLGVGEEDTFVGGLARLFPEWAFLNAGTVGFVSEQEMAWTFFELQDLAPSVVVDFTGWNDLYGAYWAALSGLSPEPYPSNSQFLVMEERLVRLREIEQSVPAAFTQAMATLVRRSAILDWIGDQRDHVMPGPGSKPVLDDGALDIVVNHFVRHLERLQEVIAGRDGHLIVVLQPEAGQIVSADARARQAAQEPHFLPGDAYWNEVPGLFSTFRRRAAERLRSKEISVLDASEYLLDRGASSRLFIDPVHLAPEGHEHMTELISEALGVFREQIESGHVDARINSQPNSPAGPGRP
ncbi:MAG: hypothetical protein MPN21_10195 [Thermoanaerobaculia bacterium]|nr:hypothetical protein [Thermoanaerobaculia bacterium]